MYTILTLKIYFLSIFFLLDTSELYKLGIKMSERDQTPGLSETDHTPDEHDNFRQSGVPGNTLKAKAVFGSGQVTSEKWVRKGFSEEGQVSRVSREKKEVTLSRFEFRARVRTCTAGVCVCVHARAYMYWGVCVCARVHTCTAEVCVCVCARVYMYCWREVAGASPACRCLAPFSPAVAEGLIPAWSPLPAAQQWSGC